MFNGHITFAVDYENGIPVFDASQRLSFDFRILNYSNDTIFSGKIS